MVRKAKNAPGQEQQHTYVKQMDLHGSRSMCNLIIGFGPKKI